MLDPTSLFTWMPHVDQRTVRAHTLVVTLGSYVDAGHTQRLIDTHLLEHLPNHTLGHFDSDQVLDYAGRRPPILFDRDHYSSYERPEITLHEVEDRDGRPFLLLNGPEPSLQWERMAASVRYVIEQLDVQETFLLHSMPAPAPHTRPVALSRFASDPTLIDDEAPMLGTFQLSASFPGVLTVRLGDSGHRVRGVLAHVPHYIADNDYPAAAQALLRALHDDAHLAIPTEGFDLAAGLVRAQIDAQVQGSEELTEMVHTLEGGYDEWMQEQAVRSAAQAKLPSADEIGAEFEDFLATFDPDAHTDDDAPTEPPADARGDEPEDTGPAE